MEAARADLEDQIRGLESQNRELGLTLAQLRNPDFAAERLARETFGLLRPDEIVFVDAP
jgi:cell division protein FtsB